MESREIYKNMEFNKTKIDELLKKDILKELGLENLDEETKQSVLDDMTFVIMRGVWVKIFERLEDTKQTELSELIEKTPEDVDAIVGYLKKEIPDYEDVIKAEVARYKELLLAK